MKKKVRSTKKLCNHALGIFSTMKTVMVTKYLLYRKCSVCKEVEALRRAGKLYVGVSVKAESLRDFDRREYAKDLLQAYDVRGNPNPEFVAAYGDPSKRGRAGKGKAMKSIKEKKKISLNYDPI